MTVLYAKLYQQTIVITMQVCSCTIIYDIIISMLIRHSSEQTLLPTASTVNKTSNNDNDTLRTTSSSFQPTTHSEKLSPAIWIPVVSAVLLIVICVGYIIFKKFWKIECIRRNRQTQKPQSKTIKSRENSESSYELPYSIDINNEFENIHEGLYEQYKK